MTNQEMFDKVAAHLLAQGTPAMAGGKCRYRGANGTKCAIGCLIPDERYDARFEGDSVYAELVAKAAGITSEQCPLAFELQHIHDSSDPLEWAARLNALARVHNLKGLSND